MSLLVFITKKDLRTRTYLNSIINKSEELPRAVPMRPKLKTKSVGEKDLLVVLDMNIAIPREFSLIGLVGVVLAWVLAGTLFTWWVLPGVFFLFTRYFWSVRFWKGLFIKGLKKGHPEHPQINWLSCEEALDKVMD